MTSEEIQIIQDKNGIAVFGSKTAVQRFQSTFGKDLRSLSPMLLTAADTLLQMSAPSTSGLYAKVAESSVQQMKSLGLEDIASGVLRGDTGQIVHHLKFDGVEFLPNLHGLNPAMGTPPGAAAVALQLAIEAAVDELKEYLEAISQQINILDRFNKHEKSTDLAGMISSVEEAEQLFIQTGEVDSVTWSKIALTQREADTIQRLCVEEFRGLSEDILKSPKGSKKAVQALNKAEESTKFWLGLLAQALILKNRAEILELHHRAKVEPRTLDTVRQTLELRRARRTAELSEEIFTIMQGIEAASDFDNFSRIKAAFDAPKIIAKVNGLKDSVSDFAGHAELEIDRFDPQSDIGLLNAARGIAADTADSIEKTKDQVVRKFAQGDLHKLGEKQRKNEKKRQRIAAKKRNKNSENGIIFTN